MLARVAGGRPDEELVRVHHDPRLSARAAAGDLEIEAGRLVARAARGADVELDREAGRRAAEVRGQRPKPRLAARRGVVRPCGHLRQKGRRGRELRRDRLDLADQPGDVAAELRLERRHHRGDRLVAVDDRLGHLDDRRPPVLGLLDEERQQRPQLVILLEDVDQRSGRLLLEDGPGPVA